MSDQDNDFEFDQRSIKDYTEKEILEEYIEDLYHKLKESNQGIHVSLMEYVSQFDFSEMIKDNLKG